MKKMNIYKVGYKIKGKAKPEDDYIWLKAANAKDAKEDARSFLHTKLMGKRGAIQLNAYFKSLSFFIIKKC